MLLFWFDAFLYFFEIFYDFSNNFNILFSMKIIYTKSSDNLLKKKVMC